MLTVLPDRHIKVPSVITVTSPLIHSDEKVEIMQRFRREPIVTGDGEILDVPIYSGNAIRGMLRRAAALRLCDLLGVQDRELPSRSFYLLFSGGYLEGSDYAHRVDDLMELRSTLPILELFGCSFGARVLGGRLEVWRGEPVCREMQDLPGHAGHPAYETGPVHSVFDLLTEVSYSRRDDRTDMLEGESSDVQMRYQFEALIPGTRLLHGLVLQSRNPVLAGCLADAIATCSEWQKLGGRGAIGHGRFRWDLEQWARTQTDAIDAYQQHVVEHADRARDFLAVRKPAQGALV